MTDAETTKKRLVFGEEESIKYVKDHYFKTVEERLEKIVKCPLCGAKNIGCFAVEKVWDDKEKYVWGWNFDCEDDCPNSQESLINGNCDGCKLYTDENGSFEKGEEYFN